MIDSLSVSAPRSLDLIRLRYRLSLQIYFIIYKVDLVSNRYIIDSNIFTITYYVGEQEGIHLANKSFIMNRPIGTKHSRRNSNATAASSSSSHSRILQTLSLSHATQSTTLPNQEGQLSFGNLIAGHTTFTRHHPYQFCTFSNQTYTSPSEVPHPYYRKMGNQHGKVMINGETYDTHRVHHVIAQLKNDVGVYKVGTLLYIGVLHEGQYSI